MQRSELLAVTKRMLDCIDTESLEIANDIRREPATAFTDPDRFAAEKAMLRRSPHVVGWAGEVRLPGDFTTKEVDGTAVLIARDESGQLRAFVNACSHRGGRVASDCGHTSRFTCGYHAWSFRTDGTLAGIPSREMFSGVDETALGLKALPISERGGLLTVGLDSDVDVDGVLDTVIDHLSGFDFADYEHVETRTLRVSANWKLAVDVNFEGYHFAHLHRKSLFPFLTNNSVFDVFGTHCRWVFPLRTMSELRSVPEDEWPDRFNGGVVYGLFPSCVLLESDVSATMIRVYPGSGVGEAVVHVSEAALKPITDDAVREARTFALDITCAVLRDEDFPAAEQCQHGAERALSHVLIGRNEPLVQHWHETWQQALAYQDPIWAN
jgi:phenylpropionate dioxygenase-like ring-hydroxylating dioxygenase large terminal subunit